MAGPEQSRKVLKEFSEALRASAAHQLRTAELAEQLHSLGGDGDRLPALGAIPTPAPGKEIACPGQDSTPASESPSKSPPEKQTESRPGGSRRFSTAEL